MLRLKEKYNKEVAPALQKKYNFKSIMQVPKLEKIVVNIGVGDATTDSKRLEDAVEEITLITGQRPVVTKSKVSISSFKLRENQGIGAKVTLRGKNMWGFLDKLVTIALPRVRDFRGISDKSFDGRGNYTLGIKEQIIFLEIDYDKVKKVRGFDVTFVTSTNENDQAKELLEMLGMPFVRRQKKEADKGDTK